MDIASRHRTRAPSRSPIVLLVALAAACDPVAGVYVRQPLAPAPTAACVGAALAASPLVATARPLDSSAPGIYAVELRDTTTLGRRAGHVEVSPQSSGGAQLTVALTQWGETTWKIRGDRARQLASLANRLAQGVRAACAPASPTAPRCRIEGFGPSRSCEVGV